MSELFIARFKVLELMMFRGPGEFDPSSRGVYSRASSLLIPSPSTIASALATVISTRKSINITSEDWIHRFKDVLGNEINIKCAFLKIGEDLYVEDRILNTMFNVKNVLEYCEIIRRVFELEKYRIEEFNELISKLKSKILKKHERVGIGLMTRKGGTKVTDGRLGLIYTVEYIDYVGEDLKAPSTEIYVDIYSENIEKGKIT